MWTSNFECAASLEAVSGPHITRNASRCLALQSTNTASAVRLLGKEGGVWGSKRTPNQPLQHRRCCHAAVVTRLEGSPSEELGEHLQGERWLVLGHLQQERHSGW